MKKKGVLLFFILPIVGLVGLLFILSTFNRNFIRERVEDLVDEQLSATSEILRVNIAEHLEEGKPIHAMLDLYKGEESIYYMALLDEQRNIMDWVSRFEGYLPLSKDRHPEDGPWIISSPAGRIFNLLSPIQQGNETVYYLYLGYSLKSLETMLTHSRRNFFILFFAILIIGIFFLSGLYRMQSRYLSKQREAEALRRDRERFKEISAFTSGVAHEIKNPLNSLSLLFELLNKKASPGTEEDVRAGKIQVQKIASIIDQFSSSLKPFDLKKESFDADELLDEARASIEAGMQGKDVDIRIVRAHPKSARLFGDRALLLQVFSNILKNAAESMEKGSIIVRRKAKRKGMEISISDQGPGISPLDQDKIFQPFFSTKKEGMGIGLYLAKRIVQSHHGDIQFSNHPGRGLTFRIHLPGG